MSETLRGVQRLVEQGDYKVSDHGYVELENDGILSSDAIEGLAGAILLEDSPNYPKGPCVLVLQRDHADLPMHVVWGTPRGSPRLAVLITAYRPDPRRWSDDFTERKS